MKIEEMKEDLRFHAEIDLLTLTERIILIHGQPKGIAKIAFYLLEEIATWLIWRKKL